MPDITTCIGTGCSKAGTCFRAKASPNPFRQSYFRASPIIKDEEGKETCPYYWKIAEKLTK